jgi:hypothetical protein
MRGFSSLSTAVVFSIAGTVFFVVPADGRERDEPAVHTDFEARDFRHGTEVDNRWLPYEPGTQYVLEGMADRGNGLQPHRVTLVVTDLTKEVDGVDTRVLYDVDTSYDPDGSNVVVNEAELALQAQDDDGNVWLLGEYPEEFEDGEFTGAPSTWVSGVEDALGGVMMRERPRPGTSKYFQALIESIEFGDEAEVRGFERRVCVKIGCFRNVLKIRETNLLSQPPGSDGFQDKYYAAGVGNIKIENVDASGDTEALELVEVKHLGSREMSRVRDAALRLDRRAYNNAPDIWGDTTRAHRER